MTIINDYLNELFDLTLKMQVSDRNNQHIDFTEGYDRIINLVKKIKDSNKKIMVVGNGGSASIACHIQTDLANLFIRSITFYNPSLLTAFSNDFGYHVAFERNVTLWAEPEDLLIGISSSGQSENILRAAHAAREKGSYVLTISGFKEDNPLRSLGDVNYYVASSHYGYVETAHSILAHSLTDYYNAKYPIT